ncbi:MAG: glycosyltransferase [Planctomycetes bacterium]|nr:glycosyltransferase [Planctomycetota bacterium]
MAARPHLEANLAALAEAAPALHERLTWPVEGGHFAPSGRGGWTYVWRRGSFDASLDAGRARELAAAAPVAGTGLVFGVGGGELVDAALARGGAWIAWERDPWVLRQALASYDWSAALREGRLRLALGADLLDLVPFDGPRVEHPFFALVYADERRWLAGAPAARRALVCTGELFVDSVVDALRAEGLEVWPFEPLRFSLEELDRTARRVAPELVVSINLVPGLAEFCEERGLAYRCWEIDPALDEPRLARPAPSARVFTYRRANVAAYEAGGFAGTRYLPLAADPGRRKPVALTDAERERYGATISFVGASCFEQGKTLATQFVRAYEQWRPGAGRVAGAALEELVRAQREDFGTYRVPELLEELAPGFRDAAYLEGRTDPAKLVAELCAAEKRLNYVAELAHLGIQAWGDEGWKVAEPHGVAYRGPAKHATELPLVYNASLVNLDVNRLYQGDIVTMRVFDICACGGFVLAEHSDALAELFEVGVELASYRTLAELREKAAYYLAHPDETRAIAERGRAAVLTRHRIDMRVRALVAG